VDVLLLKAVTIPKYNSRYNKVLWKIRLSICKMQEA